MERQHNKTNAKFAPPSDQELDQMIKNAMDGTQSPQKIAIEQDSLYLEEHEKLEPHFVCQLCSCILLDPVECSNCQISFCTVCVEDRKAKNQNQCLLCLEPFRGVSMHRVLKNKMIEMQFVCPFKCSDKLIQYDQFVQHLKVGCERIIAKCTLNCGYNAPMNYEEMFDHLKECPLQKFNCTRCNDSVILRELSEHECADKLQLIIATQEEELKQMREELMKSRMLIMERDEQIRELKENFEEVFDQSKQDSDLLRSIEIQPKKQERNKCVNSHILIRNQANDNSKICTKCKNKISKNMYYHQCVPKCNPLYCDYCFRA